MALTVQQCAGWIGLTLGGIPDPVLSTLQLVNMAGRHLVGMTSWRFLEGVEATLDTVAAQTYIALPANFSSMVSIEAADGAERIEWTTREGMNALRTDQSASGGGGLTYAVVETVAASGTTPPTPRLAIFPPSAATYRIVYRAGWADMTGDGDHLPFQVQEIETLYILILQAHARALQREEQGTLSMRLAEIQGEPNRPGPVYRAALTADRRKQRDHGQIRGAIHARRRGVRVWPFPGYSTGP